MSRSRTHRLLVLAGIAAAAALAPAPSAMPAQELIVGGQIPRVEPFNARAVPCAKTSCLAISWRVRGDIGPGLTWRLTVVRPDGGIVYRGSGRSRTGRKVRGLLHPSTPPRCGRYTIRLRVSDVTEDHVVAERIALRRHRCQRPAGRR